MRGIFHSVSSSFFASSAQVYQRSSTPRMGVFFSALPAFVFSASLTLSPSVVAGKPSTLSTHAESTQFRETGRYDEVVQLCDAFAAQYPQSVRCLRFGTTPEGRSMVALFISQLVTQTNQTNTSPKEDATKKKSSDEVLPVLALQGGIHSGEIDGKDAGFWFIRDLLDGKLNHIVGKNPLSRMSILFVPVFNVDGHERFGPNNRPNQRGPESMGWRTTAQNLNLNRDWMKADAPEMQALLKLYQEYDPTVVVDMHVTDGAKFQHDISILVEPAIKGPEPLQTAARSVRDAIMQHLKTQKHLPLDFYPEFDREGDPSSGVSIDVTPPRLSQGYFGARDRIGVLVETHSWQPYANRVQSTYDLLVGLSAAAYRSGKSWRDAEKNIDAQSASLAGKDIVLRYKMDENPAQKPAIFPFRGYEYERRLSEVSGQLWTIYDESKPTIWNIPLHTAILPDVTVKVPQQGYLVPSAYASMVQNKLDIHGIQYKMIDAQQAKQLSARLSVFTAEETKFAPAPYEGRTPVTVAGSWKPLSAPQKPHPNDAGNPPWWPQAGYLFVPIQQPHALLLVHLLEPTAPDSLVKWGFFNGCFEQKEYMEDYVTEEQARKMMSENPQIREEFIKKITNDPAFAGNPEERLKFFYKKHPAFDKRYRVYPVLRVD